MGEESPKRASTPSGAVFLSYASQDAEAAQRICTALRAAGIEVWFDQSELRGGESWDRQIRQQIHDCRLFLALISAHTEGRDEGYFRREWRLAVERAGDMAEDKAFVVPVAIDDTSERGARVPDSFKRVQWARLPGGETTPAFVERIRRLMSLDASTTSRAAPDPAALRRGMPAPGGRLSRRAAWAAFALAVAGVGAYLAYEHPRTGGHTGSISTPPATPASAASATFSPPPHSIAVLPFVNMSGDKNQEYFSDGLTEELLNSLAEIHELQVAARTSAFSFKGKDADIATIARKLNVGAVLEGSVRRSGNTVRVTTQLINAVTGFHLWSHTYDRDLGDVLKLETEIAGAVASALKVSLLGEVATKIELGGTRNPAAFDAYLRGRKTDLAKNSDEDYQTSIAAYSEAIELDPNYALALANRSLALSSYAGHESGQVVRVSYDKAIALAPDLAEGHLALAVYFTAGSPDFAQASAEWERALALAPGNARVLRGFGLTAVVMGRTEAGIAAARRAVVLDPLNSGNHLFLARALYFGRDNKDAIAATQNALALDPEDPGPYAVRGLAYFALGDFERARASCETKPDYSESLRCLAVTYDRLGRHADAEAALAKYRVKWGDAAPYQYAQIYAQWGNTPKALEWLETALRLRDRDLGWLKVSPLLDPLRNEPRFRAVERAVEREWKFPN
jgi:TolB-like protein/cytochrome c-type biogenesis protein CcmH/NrfG